MDLNTATHGGLANRDPETHPRPWKNGGREVHMPLKTCAWRGWPCYLKESGSIPGVHAGVDSEYCSVGQKDFMKNL